MRNPRLPLVLRVVVLGVLVVAATACVTTSSRPTPKPGPAGEAAQYNLQLGITYLRQNNLQAARQKLEKALEQAPDLATAHAALGLVFERLEDPAGAERHYRRAVDLDSSDPDNLNALAVFTCSRKQDPRAALKLFDRAIAIPLSVSAANRPMLYTNAGTCAKSVDLARFSWPRSLWSVAMPCRRGAFSSATWPGSRPRRRRYGLACASSRL
jgi:type IV pilus assembly protein PilF